VCIINTAVFGYVPGDGYQSSDTLKKGFGYWVKVNQDGLILFNATARVEPCGQRVIYYRGKSYNTVLIGEQCWMRENLDVGSMIPGSQSASNNDTIEKYCYDDNPANCMYGGLYQWDEAMQYVTSPGVRGICPAGWHIPTLVEFQTLSSKYFGSSNPLKALGQGSGGGIGTNGSGFSALPGGEVDQGGFFNIGVYAYFWSSTEIDSLGAYFLNIAYPSSGLGTVAYTKDFGFSVRCLED
jgi:uncharacterized protein (TIGR02145 family)